jgi:hypothetical protein
MPDSINFDRSSPLDPPWPDLVISCGRHYGVVAQWVKQRAAADGHRIAHVQLGRIAAPMTNFDLVAAPAQYGLPDAPNLVRLTLPIVRPAPQRRAAVVEFWQPRLAHLPRPWTAALVGGEASRVSFGAAEAKALAARLIDLGRASGGTVMAVFGLRTPIAVRNAIRADLAAQPDLPQLIVDWPPPEPNPYAALVDLADRFLVTSDSASMIADACITDKPVELFPLPISNYVKRLSSRGLGLSIDTRRGRRRRSGLPPDLLDRLRDALVRRHWMRPWDEIRDYHYALQQAGILSTPLDAAAGGLASAVQAREIAELTRRIGELVERHPAGCRGADGRS